MKTDVMENFERLSYLYVNGLIPINEYCEDLEELLLIMLKEGNKYEL